MKRCETAVVQTAAVIFVPLINFVRPTMFRALHNPDHPHYRRLICRHWRRHGACERGIFCNFAHGRGERRPPPVVSKITAGTDDPLALGPPSAATTPYRHIAQGYVVVDRA